MTNAASATGSVTTAPRARLPRTFAWALGSGTILQGLNSAVIAVALVPITDQFGASSATPWLVSGLYVAAAVGAPTGGRLVDMFGARRLYLTGLTVIMLASIAGPFVPGVGWLVADRVLLGLGTSLQFPAAMSAIRQQAERRNASALSAIGIVALCGQTTVALGPVIGGLVVVVAGWPGIFWVNVPMVLNAAVWVLVAVPPDPAPALPGDGTVDRASRAVRARVAAVVHRIDLPGLLLFVASLASLMIAVLTIGEPTAVVAGAAFVPLVVAFLVHERRTDDPFLDLGLLARNPQIAMTCLRCTVTYTAFYIVFYGVPEWAERTAGLDAAGAGFVLSPVFVVGVGSTVLATRLGRRLPARTLLLIGSGAMAVAGGVLALVVTGHSPFWVLVVAAALFGIPNGFNNLGNQLMLHRAAPASAAGAATGLYRTAQYIGAAASAVIVAHVLHPSAPRGGIGVLGAWVLAIGLALVAANVVAAVRVRRARLAAR